MTPPRTAESIAIVDGRSPPNRRFGQLVRLAAGFRDIVEVPHAGALEPDNDAVLVTCWAHEARQVAAVCDDYLPRARMIVFLAHPSQEIIEIASETPRISCILGWPDEAPLPRIWELAYATARLAAGSTSEFSTRMPLQWDGVGGTWYPRSTQGLFATLEDLGSVLERSQIDRRVARRVIGVAHEMLMNALYDAPTENGSPRFAHDRTQNISLAPIEAPSLVLSTDGLLLSLRISDPFGGLRRDHVFNSIARGARAKLGGRADEVIDTSGGGAGLGLHRIVSEASTTVFDIVESQMTAVTSTFDLCQPNRERRNQPTSLLYFQRDR